MLICSCFTIENEAKEKEEIKLFEAKLIRRYLQLPIKLH